MDIHQTRSADENLKILDRLIGTDIWVKVFNPDYNRYNSVAFIHPLEKLDRSYGYDNKISYKCEVVLDCVLADGGYTEDTLEAAIDVSFFNEFDIRVFIFQDEVLTTDEVVEFLLS